MNDAEKRKTETSLASMHLHGAAALLRMVRGAAADPAMIC